MSWQTKWPLHVQRSLKPKIEDLVPDYLNDAMKQSALDFIVYLRVNKMQPVWQSTNTWRANHKGQQVCTVRLSENSWCVAPRISRWNKLISSYNMYEKQITEEGLKETVLANINYCRSCANCGPGWTMDFFGKDHENVCHNVPVRYTDPGDTEIHCIKRILTLICQTVAEHIKTKNDG